MDLQIQKHHSRADPDLDRVTTGSFDARDFSESWTRGNWSKTRVFQLTKSVGIFWFEEQVAEKCMDLWIQKHHSYVTLGFDRSTTDQEKFRHSWLFIRLRVLLLVETNWLSYDSRFITTSRDRPHWINLNWTGRQLAEKYHVESTCEH